MPNKKTTTRQNNREDNFDDHDEEAEEEFGEERADLESIKKAQTRKILKFFEELSTRSESSDEVRRMKLPSDDELAKLVSSEIEEAASIHQVNGGNVASELLVDHSILRNQNRHHYEHHNRGTSTSRFGYDFGIRSERCLAKEKKSTSTRHHHHHHLHHQKRDQRKKSSVRKKK